MSIELVKKKRRVVCVMGNSHVGALKRAWDRMSNEHEDFDLVFFGQRGMGLKGLECEGSALVPSNDFLKRAIMFTSGGKDRIDVDEFDAIVLYALGANPFFRDERQFFSNRAIRQAAQDTVSPYLSFDLLKKVRAISPKVVYLGHTPLPAAKKQAVDQTTDSYVRGLQLLNELVYSQMNAKILPQPLETIVNRDRTDIRFAGGSRRLAVGDQLDDAAHDSDDVIHMNDEFGKLWLKSLFADLPPS